MAAETIKPHNKRLNDKKVIRQRIEKGMSLQEIADNQGVSKQAVSQLLAKVTDNQIISTYKNQRADIYATLEHEIYNSIDDEDIKSASLLQRVTAAGILKTHENLERGKATSIINDYQIRVILDGLPDKVEAQPVIAADYMDSNPLNNIHNVELLMQDSNNTKDI